LQWGGQRTWIREVRNAYKILVVKPLAMYRNPFLYYFLHFHSIILNFVSCVAVPLLSVHFEETGCGKNI
jgi:hypothetical protein